MDEAAQIALETVLDLAPDLESVRRIRFVLFDAETLEAHEAALTGLRAEAE